MKILSRQRFMGPNEDILLAKGDLPYWVIAQHYNVHEQTVRNWIRSNKLSEEKKADLLKTIEMLKVKSEKKSY